MKLPRLILPLLVTSAIACAQDSADEIGSTDTLLGPGEVAIVGGERIAESVFRLFTIGALQTNADNLTPEGRAEVVDRLVYIQLLAQEAERSGIHQERRIAAELELQRMQLLARSMAQRFAEENPPTEAELRDFYQENLDQIRATRYKTRHILVDTEEEAEDLLEELEDGEDFAELAQEFSTDASATDGGDLGWIQSETVVEPFATAIVNAIPGQPYTRPNSIRLARDTRRGSGRECGSRTSGGQARDNRCG